MSETQRLAVVGFGSVLVWGLAAIGGFGLLLHRLGRRTLNGPERAVALIALFGAALELGCFLYGVFIEADQLDVQRITVTTPKLPAGQRVVIAHVSDLHVDRASPALEKLVAAVKAVKPDLLIFTGDSVNSREGLTAFQQTMKQLDVPLGRFAVKGNHDVWYWFDLDLFGGATAIELNARAPVAAGPIELCGAPYGQAGLIDDCLRAADPARFTLVAYHTPDLIEDLAPRPDLYLAGHTHGGQVRAPLYGAIITLARHGKKYEMGRYEVNGTTLYVNRGIGFEPHAPRVRFLAPPELTVVEVSGSR